MTHLAGHIVRDRYQDSVRLMRISEAMRGAADVRTAAVIMATPANVTLLRSSGLDIPALDGATPNDIVLAVLATSAAAAEVALEEGLRLIDAPAPDSGRVTYASLDAALADAPAGAVGLVATPGSHAAAEARRLLDHGHSVVVFSDNVPVEDERSLKEAASAMGLMAMGPDAGTALLGGMGLGFSNRVPSGRIGIVAASGTGAQSVSAHLASLGEGVSAIIGLGSRDPSDAIGGITLFDALDAFDGDGDTEVVVLLAKAIGHHTWRRLLARLATMATPVVTLLPGLPDAGMTALVGATPAFTLRGAAEAARAIRPRIAQPTATVPMPVPADGVIRGRFAGGTLAQEAEVVLRLFVTDPQRLDIIDLGDDRYTLGRPHPMIAPSIVADAVAAASADPETAAVLFDVVLGDGAHPDPARVIAQALSGAASRRRAVPLAAVLCGTEDDPQDLVRSRATLEAAGCTVFADPAAAGLALAGGIDAPETAHARQTLPEPSVAIVVGPEWFAAAVEAQGFPALHVDWKPPAGGADDLIALLSRLT